jgi:methyl-accepting chemotaxis protein
MSSTHDNASSRDSDTMTAVDTIRDVAEASARIRDLVRAVRQSGAIDEVSTAVQEAVIAARDGTKEINEIAKALKDTATQVEETAVAAREIGEAMRHLTQHINRFAIVTSETVREAATKVKSKKKS